MDREYFTVSFLLRNRDEVFAKVGIQLEIKVRLKEAEIQYYEDPIECRVLIDDEIMECKLFLKINLEIISAALSVNGGYGINTIQAEKIFQQN